MHIGNDLHRPECILATKDNFLWCADARGGVVKIAPNGGQKLIANSNNLSRKEILNGNDLPNGMAFTKDGHILIANFGRNCLEIMDLKGNRKTLYDSIDGNPIGKVNFVLRDSKERLWITVSTTSDNWIEVM